MRMKVFVFVSGSQNLNLPQNHPVGKQNCNSRYDLQADAQIKILIVGKILLLLSHFQVDH